MHPLQADLQPHRKADFLWSSTSCYPAGHYRACFERSQTAGERERRSRKHERGDCDKLACGNYADKLKTRAELSKRTVMKEKEEWIKKLPVQILEGWKKAIEKLLEEDFDLSRRTYLSPTYRPLFPWYSLGVTCLFLSLIWLLHRGHKLIRHFDCLSVVIDLFLC